MEITSKIKEALRGRKFKLIPTPGGEADYESLETLGAHPGYSCILLVLSLVVNTGDTKV